MPVSKRSAKRRAKLKKRGNNTYSWAVRKVQHLSQEEIEQLIQNANLAVEQVGEGVADDMQG